MRLILFRRKHKTINKKGYFLCVPTTFGRGLDLPMIEFGLQKISNLELHENT